MTVSDILLTGAHFHAPTSLSDKNLDQCAAVTKPTAKSRIETCIIKSWTCRVWLKLTPKYGPCGRMSNRWISRSFPSFVQSRVGGRLLGLYADPNSHQLTHRPTDEGRATAVHTVLMANSSHVSMQIMAPTLTARLATPLSRLALGPSPHRRTAQ